ncbi:monocarboxylate transporter 13-like [Diadema antillarum]|uniref:monocarboxylate transporter 13-like n=1 Tax=Diadema antillarum TaxID=105358 RepID=UPI003A83E7F9
MTSGNGSSLKRWRNSVLLVLFMFAIRFIEIGVIKSFGVLVDDLVIQLDSNYATIGIIIATYHGVVYFLAPIILPAMKHISRKAVTVICVLGATSLCLASLSTNVAQLAIALVTAGVANAVIFMACVMLFNQRVSEAFAFLFGLSETGNSVGMMILPLLTEFFREVYGWRGAILLLGGISMQIAGLLEIATMVTRDSLVSDDPQADSVDSESGSGADKAVEGNNSGGSVSGDEHQQKQASTSLDHGPCESCYKYGHRLWTFLDLSVVIDEPFLIPYILYSILSGIVNVAWLIFLIPHGQARGFPLSKAVYLASFGGIGNMLGRILQGPIVDMGWLSSVDLIVICVCVNSIVFFLDPLLQAFWLLGGAAFLGGLTIGARITLDFIVLKQFAPPSRFYAAYGLTCLCYGIGESLGGILAGWIANVAGFKVAFMALGGMEVLACLLMICTRLCVRKQR